jgi:hypothetical protein
LTLYHTFTTKGFLYYLCFRGYKSTYGIERDYESLISVLCAKYSNPDIHYGLPNWDEKNADLVIEHQKSDYIETCGYSSPGIHYYDCDIWEIGNKRIEVRLYFYGKFESYSSNSVYVTAPNSYKYIWKHLSLVIYQKDTLERLEKEKMDIDDKEINERKKKEKEDIEKAIKAL